MVCFEEEGREYLNGQHLWRDTPCLR